MKTIELDEADVRMLLDSLRTMRTKVLDFEAVFRYGGEIEKASIRKKIDHIDELLRRIR